MVGQLCCGDAYCGYPYNDYYGRFDRAWNSVSNWLDPLGQGPITLDGLDPAAPGNCGSAVAYGAGCPGSFGLVPELTVSGCLTAGGSVQLGLTKGKSLSSTLLFLGLQRSNTPLGSGCALQVQPILPLIVGPLPLNLAGATTLTAGLPAGAAAGQVTVQAFVIDAGVTQGYTNSNGVELTIQ